MPFAPLSAIRADPASLPRRPWLRRDQPLLWRDDTTLDAGWGSRRLILADVPRDLMGWAYRLRGDLTLDAVVDQAVGLGHPADRAHALLAALGAVGALDDAAVAPRCLTGLEVAERDRAEGERAALRLAGHDPRSAATAIDARRRAVVGIAGEGDLAECIAGHLHRAGIAEVLRQAPPPDGSRRSRDRARRLTAQVLAGDWHPDCVDDAGSMAHDMVHMPVTVPGDRAVIGPLVLPGFTGCLRCADLHRRDRDPAWPRLAAQLATRRPARLPQDPLLVELAAAHAAMALRAWIDGGGPEHRRAGRRQESGDGLDGVARTISIPGGTATDAPRPAHPLCGCRWGARA